MKLMRCGVCDRVMELWGPSKDEKRKTLIEVQGPNTHKNIKFWCGGHCEGVIADIGILVHVLTETGSAKRVEWAEHYRRDIERDIVKTIRGLVRDRKRRK